MRDYLIVGRRTMLCTRACLIERSLTGRKRRETTEVLLKIRIPMVMLVMLPAIVVIAVAGKVSSVIV